MLVFSLLMLLALRNRFDFGLPLDPNFERAMILVLLHAIAVDDVRIWVLYLGVVWLMHRAVETFDLDGFRVRDFRKTS